MRVLIVSDTHGSHRNLDEVLERVEKLMHSSIWEMWRTVNITLKRWRTARLIWLQGIMISFHFCRKRKRVQTWKV